MIDIYKVEYSLDAYNDLRKIYSYIANELHVPETAAKQLKRIREKIRSLDMMPSRHVLVNWEPWHSMNMHQFTIDHYIVYYLIDDENKTVTVARVFYSSQDIMSLNKQ